MIKINFSKKISFVKSPQLLYSQKIGIYQEDELFNVLSKDHKLNNPFSYQMAFLKYNEIYHCFLTPISKLNKSSYCFPEPLIFQALYDENLIEENNFCILNLYDKTLYLYFYEEGKFTSLKKIANFNQDDIELFLKQNRFLELLEHYDSKIILHYNLYYIKNHISKEIKCLNLDTLLNKNSLEKLSLYSIKHLDPTCNFIKHDKLKIPLYIKIIFLFILSFSLSIAILLFGDFIKYKQNQVTQSKNTLTQKDFFKLKENKQELLKSIQDLNSTLNNKTSLAQEQSQILSSLVNTMNTKKDISSILNYTISWLNDNKLKIIYLKIQGSKIILIFGNKNNFDLALKYLSSHFKILNKSENEYKIILEKIHD
ncbi:hypothetical protein DZD33_01950 [Campylobacter hepaticus]|uniref:Transmembrane protein n=2 Tax=Campylobacter hepaticus TaxID=1813019 RepID=A0A424Z010_9BACT|nr:hypothetical protein [Campylobacter hepaticus]AXP08743.1 hypothetical protein A2J15_003340 [Campylobacter hepaticus]MPV53706.1 hypothetical protein [Campylobacter hepaticus]MPV61789.1 hypothetical protein [Campylobacter hepaticus]MPV78391.1 hypothetical protein [Campylobacter hepaticus]MPV79664.1 hypothetical protein [Campylobacter hepaticus]